MATTVLEGDVLVRGTLRANAVALPNGAVGNTQFTSGDPLAASKQEHQYAEKYTQPSGTDATAVTQVIHHAHAAGTVVGVEVGAVVPATGTGNATVDIKKNGTTILSGVVTIDSSTAAYVAVLGAISVAAYAAGDTFTVVTTAATGSGSKPQGLYVSLILRESAV